LSIFASFVLTCYIVGPPTKREGWQGKSGNGTLVEEKDKPMEMSPAQEGG